MLKLRLIRTGIMLLCIVPVSACGKKPAHVDPPSDVEDDAFPKIYPDPNLNK